MKKILFITAFPPNNKSGGQVFSLNLIKDLAKEYGIDLIYFNYKNHDPAKDMPVNFIKAFNVNNMNCFCKITMHPAFTRRFNKEILSYIVGMARKYDIVFFDHTQVGLYSVYLEHPYKIIRCHDIFFQKFSRKNQIFKYCIKTTEEKILKSVEKVFVPSKKDADLVKKIYDLDARFTHEYIRDFRFFESYEKTNIFIFFGMWSRKENLDGLIWFVKKVIPLLNQDIDIKFKVIGSGLTDKVKKKYFSPCNIEYLGFIDNPRDVIYSSRAVIAPLFTGAGVKVKVIDAFTTGTPVIGTDITFEGLPFFEDLVYRAVTPQEYANIIQRFPKFTWLEKQKNAAMFRTLYDTNHLLEQL
jgi:glycosyltransferase involved in cell wall biosynthesis